MSTHFNELTPAEVERLAILAEECAEVIQIVGKVLRHGYESHHPKDPLETSNRELLAMEIGHIWAAVGIMLDDADLLPATIAKSKESKAESVKKYTHHQ